MIRSIPPFWRTFTSGSFFTIWSWLLPLPVSLIFIGAWSAPTTSPDQFPRLALVALLCELCIGIILAVNALLERVVKVRVLRALIVLFACGVLAFARLFSISFFAFVVDVETVKGGDFFDLMIAIYPVYSVLLIAIATAVMIVHKRRSVLASLRRVADALLEQRTAGIELLASATREVERVRETLLEVWPGSPTPRAQDLRKLSLTARSLSHDLELPPEPAPEPLSLRSARPARLSPAPPGIAMLLFLLAVAPYQVLLAVIDVPFPWAAYGACVVVGALGEIAMWRWARGPRATVLVLALGALTAALASLALATGSIAGTLQWSWVVTAVIYFSCIVVSALCTEIMRQLSQEEATLRERLREYSIDELDGRLRARAMLAGATATLHTGIQGEALRLAMLVERGDSVDLSALRCAVEQLGTREMRRDPEDARAELEGLFAAWEHALDLTVTAEEGAWGLLAIDDTLAISVDALSESFTNILKHAQRPAADVALLVASGALRVRVVSPGRLLHSRERGRGLEDLREVTSRVSLAEQDGNVVLEVDFNACSSAPL